MCPPAERLVDLVAGRLDADAERAIEEHIDTCEACRLGLAAAVRGDTASTSSWALGRYRIDEQIGAGGMGIVYRAWDPALSREIAIKVVKSDDVELRTRLAREAQSMARLNHRNVCQIYDVGTDGDELWIAMELVRGTTLRTWVVGKRAIEEVLPLVVDAGRGLAAAHAAGLVHRDVKPENILVDREGRAVVSDFGLARDLSAGRMTRTSALAGTPAYMAPEQLDGHVADARSDQYAFAVTAHEVLVGAKPRPRNRASQVLPLRLRAAFDRALAEQPSDRFPTIGDFVDALVPRAAASRLRTVAIAAGAAVIAAVAVGGVWLTTRESDRIAPRIEVRTPVVAVVPVVTEIVPDAAVALVEVPADAAPAIKKAAVVAKQPNDVPVDVPVAAPPPVAPGAVTDLGTAVQTITRAVVAGDGKTCLATFAMIDGQKPPDAMIASMNQLRGQCLMLAGQCEAGKKIARAYWQTYNFAEDNLDKSVDLDVSLHCRAGTRAPRDRLLRAMYVLGDYNYKHTLAECREAYGEAKQLVGTIPSKGPMDMLDDSRDRFGSYAPGCFARAGDCATAWRVAKERDAEVKNPSTGFTQRSAFVNAVGLLCSDKEQGALSDVEIVWRAIVELDNVKQGGTSRTSDWCTARIERGEAALARWPADDPELKRTRDWLAREGRDCLAATSR